MGLNLMTSIVSLVLASITLAHPTDSRAGRTKLTVRLTVERVVEKFEIDLINANADSTNATSHHNNHENTKATASSHYHHCVPVNRMVLLVRALFSTALCALDN
jgi:hypothetical protein